MPDRRRGRRRHHVALGGPQRDQLRDLLVQRHPPDQVADAQVDGRAGVIVQRAIGDNSTYGGGHQAGQRNARAPAQQVAAGKGRGGGGHVRLSLRMQTRHCLRCHHCDSVTMNDRRRRCQRRRPRNGTRMMTLFARIVLIAGLLSAGAAPALAEDGYDLWMRYPATTIAPNSVSVRGDTPMLRVAAAELRRALPAGPVRSCWPGRMRSPTLQLPTATLGDEGYLVRAVRLSGRAVTLVTGNTDRGVLYGAFALLRQLATGGTGDRVDAASPPRVKLRVLNHWDNLDGTVERGYAGQSLWDWWTLPDYQRPALHRLCARQRVDRHQRHRPQQRQRQGRQPDRAATSPRRRRSPTCSGPTASASTCRRASPRRSSSAG